MNAEITTKDVFLYIEKVLKSFPAALFVMFCAAIVFAVDTAIKPYILKVILDRAADSSTQNIFQYLTIPSLCYLLINFALSTSWRVYDYFVQINMIPKLRAKIANESLGLLLDKSHIYFQNNFSGSLANKVNDLTGNVPDILQIAIDRFFSHGLALIFAICTLWQVNVRFALFTLAWTVIFTIGAVPDN